MTKEFLEDYTVGEKLVSPGRTITEADVVGFAGLTGDWHPLHTDCTFAAETPFGERIAHGLLVLSIGSALAFRLGPHAFFPRSFIALYALERVRFKNPVKFGDTIHLEGTVMAVDTLDSGRGVLQWQSRIVNQRGELCCRFVSKLLCGRRP